MRNRKDNAIAIRLEDDVKIVWNTVCRRENRQVVMLAVLTIVVLFGVINCIRNFGEWRREKIEAKVTAAVIEETVEEPAVFEEPAEKAIPQQYIEEAEAVARVLYGIRDSSVRDQRTYIWCIFNRVDNPSQEFANTLEDVIGKPEQWMSYDESNPILESLYQIALSEVEIWHEGHRPVSCDYVFAEWHPDKILLRKTLDPSDDTWRYSE